jgi:hypothetical protein
MVRSGLSSLGILHLRRRAEPACSPVKARIRMSLMEAASASPGGAAYSLPSMVTVILWGAPSWTN